MRHISYHSLVLAGGGNRCLWQVGFWDACAKEIGLAPKVVAGVSAGACMGAVILAEKTGETLDRMKETFAENPKNMYLENLFSNKPVFPHYGIYLSGLLTLFEPEVFEKIKKGPELRVLAARFPRGVGAIGAVVMGFFCYTLEKHIKKPLHPQWALKAGFKPVVKKLNDCETPEEASKLIIASSATPPFVGPIRLNGHQVLDGGLVDNVPVVALKQNEGPALVLLSRRYPPGLLKGHKGRTYLQPSKPVGITKWDDTSPQGLQDAYDLGKKDGELFLRKGPEALQD
ncbi:patatin-like phospholipase family protein [Dethiosulfatarculus sandiegensis]|uniref:patatin-like phospholipase family protein n=1 Tax=Dethiosulfatarculus sandiegensis TaxID=1429043 RepID=UPI0005C9F95F|nr:patatin-like phospholipase family protein [Dethiosulfatarculus sandiegensis]